MGDEDEDYDEEETDDDTEEVNQQFTALTSHLFPDRTIERRILDWVIFLGVSAMIVSIVAIVAGIAAWVWKNVLDM